MSKEYKKSVDLWIESQEYLIEELKLKLNFTKDNINILKKVLKNTENSLLHEENQLNKFIQNK
jgi:hypothetical protein